MKLAEFLIKEKLSDAEFARRIGVSRMMVGRYRRHDSFPRANKLRRIREETAGAVTSADFYDAADGRDAQTQRSAAQTTQPIQSAEVPQEC